MRRSRRIVFCVSRAEARRTASFNAEASVISIRLQQVGSGAEAAPRDEALGYPKQAPRFNHRLVKKMHEDERAYYLRFVFTRSVRNRAAEAW
jgi:hypothetical protein